MHIQYTSMILPVDISSLIIYWSIRTLDPNMDKNLKKCFRPNITHIKLSIILSFMEHITNHFHKSVHIKLYSSSVAC